MLYLALNLARRRVHLHGLLARALACARIGARALAAHRQALAMPNTAIAAEIHQTLDVHGHLAPQVTLDGEFRHLRAQGCDFRLRQVLDLDAVLDARGIANLDRALAA